MKKIFIFLSVLLLVACSTQKKESTPGSINVNELPAIPLTLISGERVMVNSLGGNTILIFYVPDCDHCQREAEAIRNQLEVFKNYSLYFIAASEPEEIKRFAERYQLNGRVNVFFARAEVADVVREMGPVGTPALYIYSHEKRLIKKFDGETQVAEIAEVL